MTLSPSQVRLLDLLFTKPVVTVADISSALGISHLADQFEKLEILRKITGKKRYKKYLFADYLRIIERGTGQ